MLNSDEPMFTVVIPSRDRPQSVIVSVQSALQQTGHHVEVIVVDDGSRVPLELPAHDCLRLLRLERSQGVAAARNAGLAVSRGRWITFLDDDDVLLPGMAEAYLSAIEAFDGRQPFALISGMEVIGKNGQILERRLPATHERGEHFSLEPLPPGRSHTTKNTLVVKRSILLSLGGFDTSLGACEWIDLFLRLNPVCSIIGLSEITYRLARQPAPRFSRDRRARETAFRRLVEKHRDLFASHPQGYADALLGEARMSLASGSWSGALLNLLRAMSISPLHSIQIALNPLRALKVISGLRSSG